MFFLMEATIAGSLVLAAAQPVPTFDVDPSCRAAALSAAAAKDMTTCRDKEQTARDEIAKQWSEVSDADKAQCVPLSKLGGSPSYVELLTCIELTREARRLRNSEPEPSAAATTAPATTGQGGR
jgi:hypothetical protein